MNNKPVLDFRECSYSLSQENADPWPDPRHQACNASRKVKAISEKGWSGEKRVLGFRVCEWRFHSRIDSSNLISGADVLSSSWKPGRRARYYTQDWDTRVPWARVEKEKKDQREKPLRGRRDLEEAKVKDEKRFSKKKKRTTMKKGKVWINQRYRRSQNGGGDERSEGIQGAAEWASHRAT